MSWISLYIHSDLQPA